MDKILQLKIASFILFWFGVMAQLLVTAIIGSEYLNMGYSPYLTTENSDPSSLKSIFNFVWYGFIHLVDLPIAYSISKGRKIGLILGIIISIWEIFGILSSQNVKFLFTPEGMFIRILFAFALFLFLSGRKELASLKSENWRPWKNPLHKISSSP